MEFLTKAAALAVSVLASLFTSVEEPKPATNLTPATSQVAHQLPSDHALIELVSPDKFGGAPLVHIVVFKKVSQEQTKPTFVGPVISEPKVSKPLAVVPWYAKKRTEPTPSVSDTADVIRALLSSDSDLY